MIEFRYAVPERTTTHEPVLQYRECVAVDASGAFCPGRWGPWQTIPKVVVSPEEWKALRLHLGDGDRGSQHPAQEPGA